MSGKFDIDPDNGVITESFPDSSVPFDAVYSYTQDGMSLEVSLTGIEWQGEVITGTARLDRDSEHWYDDRTARRSYLLLRALRYALSAAELALVEEMEQEDDEVSCCDDGPVDGGDTEDIQSEVDRTLGAGHGPDSDCPTCQLIFTSLSR